jgi:ubiquinol-cytochrome c reductase iron-sulfur subunit
LVRVLWRKKPVWIFKRDKTTISNLSTLNDILVDPNSLETSQQPEYAKNPYRSINPNIAVIVGVCTVCNILLNVHSKPWLVGIFDRSSFYYYP